MRRGDEFRKLPNRCLVPGKVLRRQQAAQQGQKRSYSEVGLTTLHYVKGQNPE